MRVEFLNPHHGPCTRWVADFVAVVTGNCNVAEFCGEAGGLRQRRARALLQCPVRAFPLTDAGRGAGELSNNHPQRKQCGLRTRQGAMLMRINQFNFAILTNVDAGLRGLDLPVADTLPSGSRSPMRAGAQTCLRLPRYRVRMLHLRRKDLYQGVLMKNSSSQ